MKKIIYQISLGLLFLTGCTPDRFEIQTFDFDADDIKVLKIRTNSHILYADGLSELKLEAEAYTIVNQELKQMKVEGTDTTTKVYTQIDTVLLPASRIPEGTIRFVKEDGTEVPEGKYKTTTIGTGKFKVHAKLGGLISEPYEIEVRTPYTVPEKVVFPVIFHIIESYEYETPKITSEILQDRLDRLNDIFGRQIFFSANGGNPNLEFRLAKYNEAGKLLNEAGIDRVKSYSAGEYLWSELGSYTWDPARYLNVWICNYSLGWGESERNSLPVTVLNAVGDQTLPGLNFTEKVDDASQVSKSNPYQVGIVIRAEYDDYNDAYIWQFYNYNWEKNFGTYFGLLQTNTTYQADDYCSDTYGYSNTTMTSGTYRKRSPEDYRFDSENIMDDPSQKTTISGEQAQRIRWVLENCPSRWAYKSDFALTGK